MVPAALSRFFKLFFGKFIFAFTCTWSTSSNEAYLSPTPLSLPLPRTLLLLKVITKNLLMLHIFYGFIDISKYLALIKKKISAVTYESREWSKAPRYTIYHVTTYLYVSWTHLVMLHDSSGLSLGGHIQFAGVPSLPPSERGNISLLRSIPLVCSLCLSLLSPPLFRLLVFFFYWRAIGVLTPNRRDDDHKEHKSRWQTRLYAIVTLFLFLSLLLVSFLPSSFFTSAWRWVCFLLTWSYKSRIYIEYEILPRITPIGT